MLIGREGASLVGSRRRAGSARDLWTVASGANTGSACSSSPSSDDVLVSTIFRHSRRHSSPRAEASTRIDASSTPWRTGSWRSFWTSGRRTRRDQRHPQVQEEVPRGGFLNVSSRPELQCRGPAFPGDVKCRVADRLMNQFHNEFIRLRDWVELGEARKLVTDQHRLAHFLLRSREMVAQEVGACEVHRLEHIRNPSSPRPSVATASRTRPEDAQTAGPRDDRITTNATYRRPGRAQDERRTNR